MDMHLLDHEEKESENEVKNLMHLVTVHACAYH